VLGKSGHLNHIIKCSMKSQMSKRRGYHVLRPKACLALLRHCTAHAGEPNHWVDRALLVRQASLPSIGCCTDGEDNVSVERNMCPELCYSYLPREVQWSLHGSELRAR